MELSIIVTTRNRVKDLRNCLNSISKSSFNNFELIVIDDCSIDETKNLRISDFNFKDFKIVHSKKQLMMVGARNLGAKKAKGKYILFVDDDNIFTKDAIENLFDCAKREKNFGIIGAPIYFYKDKKKYLSSQKFNFFTGRTRAIVNTDKVLIESDGAPNVFLIKKEVFEKCGYFDPLLIQTMTEPDFAFKARQFGFKCGIFQKAVVYHNFHQEGGWLLKSLGINFKQKAYCSMRNRMVLIKRYGNNLQKIIHFLFFSWVWPAIYSILALLYRRYPLIKFYWLGFKDGVVYLLSGRLNKKLPAVLKI